MRLDAPYLVKRYARMIGRPNSRPRISVAHQAYRLDVALAFVRQERGRLERNTWLPQGPHWIERRGHAATRRGR